MSNSLWPHGLQHARLPCPSLSPGVFSDLCPLSQWCYPIILYLVIPFSSWLQSFLASGYFIVIQSLSHVQLFVTPWNAACQDSLSFTISWSLLKLMFIEWVMPSNLSFSFSPFSSHLQSFPASGSFPVIWHFASGGHFSFSISPSNE